MATNTKTNTNAIETFVSGLIRYNITQPQAVAYAAVLANVTGVSIESVRPVVQQVGRVKVFDVTPWRSFDPPIVFIQTEHAALKPYYKLWREGVNASRQMFGCVLFPQARMKNAVEFFLRGSDLDADERNFAVTGMLRFENEVLLRQQ